MLEADYAKGNEILLIFNKALINERLDYIIFSGKLREALHLPRNADLGESAAGKKNLEATLRIGE